MPSSALKKEIGVGEDPVRDDAVLGQGHRHHVGLAAVVAVEGQGGPPLVVGFFFLMIRRPPRSTLFPYTNALPISSQAARTIIIRAVIAAVWPVLPIDSQIF